MKTYKEQVLTREHIGEEKKSLIPKEGRLMDYCRFSMENNLKSERFYTKEEEGKMRQKTARTRIVNGWVCKYGSARNRGLLTRRNRHVFSRESRVANNAFPSR